jgi:putative DNA primase/helicase
MLAFWTGGDAQRMDRLFRCSGLMREKWDRETGASTYGSLTIAAALKYLGGSEFRRASPTDDVPRTTQQASPLLNWSI